MNSMREKGTWHIPIVHTERLTVCTENILNEILGNAELKLYFPTYYEDIATFGGGECHGVT